MFIKSIAILGIVALVHGWYPKSCCDESHCEPVPCSSINGTPSGDVSWNGIIFPKLMLKSTQDEDCHVCYNHSTKQPYCVFLRSGV